MNDRPLPLKVDAGGGRTKQIVAKWDWSIETLYRYVGCTLTTGDNIESFYLLLHGKPLETSKKVSDYNFKEHDKLTFIQRNPGGTTRGGFRQLPGVHLELTREPCCVLYDDSPQELRARLPCGCPSSKEAIIMMANSTLQSGAWSFDCPGCQTVLDFSRMRDILTASLTDEQLKVVQKNLDANYLRQPLNDIRQCGTCGTYSQRDFTKKWYQNLMYCAVCYTCSKRKGRSFQFCWYCGQEWKGGSTKSCGNSNCQGPEPSLKILATCKTKSIHPARDVPDTRACPKCGALITHASDCKHMDCRMCACSFCFICLKLKDEYGKWQCGDYNATCPVAPRQTTIAEFIRRQ